MPTVAFYKLMAVLVTTSRNALAIRLGVTPDTLRKIELGISRPGSRTIETMVKLGIEPSDWFTAGTEPTGGKRPPPSTTKPTRRREGASR